MAVSHDDDFSQGKISSHVRAKVEIVLMMIFLNGKDHHMYVCFFQDVPFLNYVTAKERREDPRRGLQPSYCPQIGLQPHSSLTTSLLANMPYDWSTAHYIRITLLMANESSDISITQFRLYIPLIGYCPLIGQYLMLV